MISKELLSEVLVDNVTWVQDYIELDQVIYDINCNNQDGINIYELAHKCKEWARDKHDRRIELKTFLLHRMVNAQILSKVNNFVEHEIHLCENDNDAIFKACEWIKEQHDN